MTSEDVLRLVTVHGARPETTEIEPMYVVLQEDRERIEMGLRNAGLSCPLLTVSAGEAKLLCEAQHRLSSFQISLPSPPPAIVPVDADSPAERYLELSIVEIVARAASGQDSVSLDAILEAVNPYWKHTHDAVRGAIRTKARDALKHAADRELREYFALESTSSGHVIIRILKTPANFDPRGRSQGWQAMQKKAERALRRRPRARVIPGQVSFEELGREAEAGEGDR